MAVSDLSDADLLAALGHPASGQAGPDVEGMIRAEAQRQGVDPDFAVNIGRQESGLNASVRPSPKGAIGPMQLMPGTASDLGVDPTDLAQNIRGGVAYLGQQLNAFGGDRRMAAAAYNAGPGAVRKAGGVPDFAETKAYVDAVAPGVQGLSNADLLAALGQQPNAAPKGANAAPATTPAASGDQTPVVINPETGKPYGDAQEATYKTLLQRGDLDPNAPVGSQKFPRGMVEGGQPQAGEWYVDLSGELKQAPGGEAPAYDFAKSITDPVTNAANALKTDALRWYGTNSTLPQKPSLRDLVPGLSDSDRALGSTVGDVGNLAGALLGGEVLNGAVVEPTTRALDMLPAAAPTHTEWHGLVPHTYVDNRFVSPAEQHATNSAIVNTAMMGARPATAGPFAPELPQRAGPRVTPEQLRTEARGYYTELRNRGVQFSPQAVQSLNQGLTDLMRTEDPAGTLFGEHRNWVQSVGAQMAADPSVENLDRVRSNLQKALATPTAASDPNSLRIGSALVDEIDNFLAATARHPLQMTTATPADAARVQELLTGARDTWRRMRNVQTVEDLAESAGIRNASTHMGGNAQNFTKQKLRDFIDPSKNKSLAGLSPDEQDQLRRVVMGTPVTNALKMLGNLSPTKGVGALANTIAAGMFGPHGPMIMAPIGYGANRAGSVLQDLELDRLLRMLAGGGPMPSTPLPQTVPLRSPAGLIGASVIAAPLRQTPSQKEPARTGR